MEYLIFPDIFKSNVRGLFTGKEPGAGTKRISGILSIDEKRIYMPVQRHTGDAVRLKSLMEPVVADAAITDIKGLALGIRVADCVPILIYDRAKESIAAVHAGWRGTAKGIIKKTLELINPSSGKDILIAIGPAIRWCCYGVGADVLKAVADETGKGDYHMKKDGKNCLDLPSANKFQAMSTGVPEENIWMSEECTYCRPDRFFSYRYSKEKTGRQGGFIIKT
jgi:YfiH family protein